MENFEINEIKIADYLDDKMSAKEEEAFMQELSSDRDLQKQYEDELLIRALLRENIDTDIALPVIKPYQATTIDAENAGKVNIAAGGKVKKMPVGQAYQWYKAIAASVIIIISIGVIGFIFLGRNKGHETVVQKNVIPDKVANMDSTGKNKLPVVTSNTFAESVFKKYYVPFKDEHGPVEISNYYEAYKNGEFDKILKAKTSDYQLMGTDDKNEQLIQYMHLYKGLALLSKNQPADAIQELKMVKNSAETITAFYPAQWYMVLAWLKLNNTTKAQSVAKNIEKTSSPYKTNAAELMKEM